VTPSEWLADTNPVRMMLSLKGRRLPARRLRLFAAACCRRAWPWLADRRSREAVEVLERFADSPARKADLDALKAAYRGAKEAADRAPRESRQHYAALAVERAVEPTQAWWAARWAADLWLTAAGKADRAAGGKVRKGDGDKEAAAVHAHGPLFTEIVPQSVIPKLKPS
jgi:hypothetical protein